MSATRGERLIVILVHELAGELCPYLVELFTPSQTWLEWYNGMNHSYVFEGALIYEWLFSSRLVVHVDALARAALLRHFT